MNPPLRDHVRNSVLPCALIVVLLAVWDYSRPTQSTRPRPATQAQHHKPVPPHDPPESTLQSTEMPDARFCGGEERRMLLGILGAYLKQRGNEERYTVPWGEVEWADDPRIVSADPCRN